MNIKDMFNKLPFYIGNFMACFVIGSARRARFRGNVNLFLYKPTIKRLFKTQLNIKVEKIKFVRQNTLNRVVGIVNNRWYVKIFRKVTNTQLKNYARLLNDYIAPCLSVNIPKIIVDDRMSMYVCDTVPGRQISTFSKQQILNNDKNIQSQVFNIIKELQMIDVKKIPDYQIYETGLQSHRPEIIKKPVNVLAHFDLNDGNLLFDNNMKIISVIDWDAMAIAHSSESDKLRFKKSWDRFIKRLNNKDKNK
nr:hypothetical protein [Candidatus Enterousia merdequi]